MIDGGQKQQGHSGGTRSRKQSAEGVHLTRKPPGGFVLRCVGCCTGKADLGHGHASEELEEVAARREVQVSLFTALPCDLHKWLAVTFCKTSACVIMSCKRGRKLRL